MEKIQFELSFSEDEIIFIKNLIVSDDKLTTEITDYQLCDDLIKKGIIIEYDYGLKLKHKLTDIGLIIYNKINNI